LITFTLFRRYSRKRTLKLFFLLLTILSFLVNLLFWSSKWTQSYPWCLFKLNDLIMSFSQLTSQSGSFYLLLTVFVILLLFILVITVKNILAALFICCNNSIIKAIFNCLLRKIIQWLPVGCCVNTLVFNASRWIFLRITPFTFQHNLFDKVRISFFKCLHFCFYYWTLKLLSFILN
jgi:hypothetical protein